MEHYFHLAVVIPCFNEAKRLKNYEWTRYVQSHPNYIFIFVDDGSFDETDAVLKKMFKSFCNVALIQNIKNQGKSGAVRTGFLFASNTYQYKFIAFIDADLSLPLCELDRFAAILSANEKIDFLLGSRVQMLGKKIKRNLYRHYISRVIATVICKILDEPVYDTQCGLKVFRKDIAENLMHENFISKWLFDVEILARYKLKFGKTLFNENILEVPVQEWTEKENSKLKYYQFPKIIYELIRINRNYFHIGKQ